MKKLFALLSPFALACLCHLTLWIPSKAQGTTGTRPGTAKPRLCYSMKSEECTDCPGQNSFFCDPNKNGAFTSCVQLAPSQDCKDGYCAEIDLGPTGLPCTGRP